MEKVNEHLIKTYSADREQKDTEDQFLYKTRKRAFGDFKNELWGLPEDVLAEIGNRLEERFTLLFRKLNVVNTVDLVNKFVVGKR